MKLIETNGITHIEKFDGYTKWYWGTDYASGDLYEAEEIFRKGMQFKPNRLIFVHYPDGQVFEPIKPKESQYFGRPNYIDGVIYILLVNFEEQNIYVYCCSPDKGLYSVVVKLPLSEVKDCYNLMINREPLMLTRQGADNHFQIIWPEKADFVIGERESFFVRVKEQLFFTEWHEDPEYREEINIREFPSGKLIEKAPGVLKLMPNGQHWILL